MVQVDYIRLEARNDLSTKLLGGGNASGFSAHLITGQSTGGGSGGDSIWTEEDGKAVYDGQVKMEIILIMILTLLWLSIIRMTKIYRLKILIVV